MSKEYRITGGIVNVDAIKKLKESSVNTKPQIEPFFTENPGTPEDEKITFLQGRMTHGKTRNVAVEAILKKMSEIEDGSIPTSYVVFETYPMLKLSSVQQICDIVFEDKPIIFIEEFEKIQQNKTDFKTLFTPYVTAKSFGMRGKEYPRNKLLTHEELKHMFEILKLGKFNPGIHIKPLEVNK